MSSVKWTRGWLNGWLTDEGMAGWLGEGVGPLFSTSLPVPTPHDQTHYPLPFLKPAVKTGSDWFSQEVECLHDPETSQTLLVSWRDGCLSPWNAFLCILIPSSTQKSIKCTWPSPRQMTGQQTWNPWKVEVHLTMDENFRIHDPWFDANLLRHFPGKMQIPPLPIFFPLILAFF